MSQGLGKVEKKVLDIVKRLSAGKVEQHETYKGGERWNGKRYIRTAKRSYNNPITDIPDIAVDLLEAGQVYKREDPNCPKYETVPSQFRRAVRSLKRKGYLVHAWDYSGRFVSVSTTNDTHPDNIK